MPTDESRLVRLAQELNLVVDMTDDGGDFFFFNNLKHSSGNVEHRGDNLTGTGDGDDEEIEIDLSKVPANIEKIAFTVTIYDADARKQNFGQVENAFIRVFDELNSKELIRCDLDEDFSIETAVIVGELYRNKGEWKFKNRFANDFSTEKSSRVRLPRNYVYASLTRRACSIFSSRSRYARRKHQRSE